ncbi:MAG: hypothetical protein JJLCMIEE_02727 [Acidimicrobiales bacterium]|nr:hypothetical protein [Acidimicrobiales bacterium]
MTQRAIADPVGAAGAIRRLTPEMRREQTRAYLLESAAAVFAAKGYHAASLDEIAEAAGFTRGAIYSNFGGKEGLFMALVEHRQQAMVSEFFGALDPAADRSERLQALREVSSRLMPTPSEWALFQEFELFAFRNPELRERLVVAGQKPMTAVARVLQNRCEAAGVEPPLPARDLARLCVGVIAAAAAERALDPESVSDEEIARTLLLVVDFITGASPPFEALE